MKTIKPLISASQTILTTFCGATNKLGCRIIAKNSYGNTKITYNMNYNLIEENHREAALTLCNKLGWNGRLVGGKIDGTCDKMVWIFFDKIRKEY